MTHTLNIPQFYSVPADFQIIRQDIGKYEYMHMVEPKITKGFVFVRTECPVLNTF
ncbi:ORF5 [Coconut foliar decay alphasatellite]|uniref:ORF5 n=1 Tax=Coconut foliar decay alphasatellite 1 TaxID=2161874 RepID=Q66009_9VIRU|nr:ORF5 [Coconut foliar decay alphasatellite]AAA42898.1 ORF5 [Coconut foliar decay virus]